MLRLASEFDALRLGVGAASRRAVDDPASFELRGNAEDRKDQLHKIRGRISQRLSNRAKASASTKKQIQIVSDPVKVRLWREIIPENA
jgi:hypothetical protein